MMRSRPHLSCVILAALIAALAGSAQAAPSFKDTRPTLVLVSVNVGAGFAKEQAESVEALLLSSIEATNRFHVVGRADIRSLADLESRKQQAGCKADEACMVAIAGAFGADYVASADLARLGKSTLLALKVVHVRSARAIVHAREIVTADDQLVRASDSIAAQLVSALFGASIALEATPAPQPAVADSAPPPAPNSIPDDALRPLPSSTPVDGGHVAGIAATILGGIGLAVGTGLAIAAQSQATTMRTTPEPPSVQANVSSINTLVAGAIVGWAGGGAIAATGVGLLVAF